MNFIVMWQLACESDPYWQFEELLEEDPELAEYVWDNMRISILVEKRLNASLELEVG